MASQLVMLKKPENCIKISIYLNVYIVLSKQLMIKLAIFVQEKKLN